jgi:hypothetical protein
MRDRARRIQGYSPTISFKTSTGGFVRALTGLRNLKPPIFWNFSPINVAMCPRKFVKY